VTERVVSVPGATTIDDVVCGGVFVVSVDVSAVSVGVSTVFVSVFGFGIVKIMLFNSLVSEFVSSGVPDTLMLSVVDLACFPLSIEKKYENVGKGPRAD
jgi:hypothetical protein